MNITISLISIIITTILIDQSIFEFKFAFTCLVILPYMCASYILNDIIDNEPDKINHPKRVKLYNGTSRKQRYYYLLIYLFIGIIASLQLNKVSIIISLGFVLPVMLIYTSFLKKIPLLGNVAVSLLIALIFPFIEISLTGYYNKTALISFLSFLIMLIREIIKDIQDIEGDKKFNIYTFPVVFGITKAITLSIFLKIIFIIVLFIPYVQSLFGIKYIIVITLGIIAPFMYNIYLLIYYPYHSNYKLIQKIIKFSTIVGILSIYID